MPEFTRTEQRIVNALSDGMRHTARSLQPLLPDTGKLCERDGKARHRTLHVHITNIRKKLRPSGQDILCEYYNRRTYYRHVRLIGKH